MENKPTPYNTAMNYGALLGLVLILLSITLYGFDQTMNQKINSISYFLILGGIILGTKIYRDNVCGGFINYSQALWTGTLISFFASILWAFYTYISLNYIDTDLIQKIVDGKEQEMIEQNMTEEQIDIGMKYTKMLLTPIIMSVAVIIWNTIVGFIFSLITSLVIKKENPNQSFENVIDNS